MKHAPTVYVITNGTGAIYVGATTDLKARIARHNAREGAAFTKEHGGYWREVYSLAVSSMAEARCIEGWWTAQLEYRRELPFVPFRPTAWPKRHADHWHRYSAPGEAPWKRRAVAEWLAEPARARAERREQARQRRETLAAIRGS